MATLSKTKLNTALGMLIVLMSLLTIIWHHQSYQLFIEAKKVKSEYHQLLSFNKQLLIEQSQVISGEQIKKSAIKLLLMHEPGAKDLGKYYKGRIEL